MKIKVITSYKPGTWESYAKKGIESMAEQFPQEVDIVVYAEEPKPHCDYERITWIDLNSAEPELFQFKNKHKDDPGDFHQPEHDQQSPLYQVHSIVLLDQRQRVAITEEN